jgi:hypothetical protein
VTATSEPPVVRLEAWTGPWRDDDPDANFKADIATYAHVDPLTTVTNLAGAIDVPVGAIVRYVLARWATEGSAGLLELGPHMARRLASVVEAAEADPSDDTRLAAYAQLRDMVRWLNLPLDDPDRSGY